MPTIQRLSKVERELRRMSWTFCIVGVLLLVAAVAAWWFGRSIHLWLLPGFIATVAGGMAWGHADSVKQSIIELHERSH